MWELQHAGQPVPSKVEEANKFMDCAVLAALKSFEPCAGEQDSNKHKDAKVHAQERQLRTKMLTCKNLSAELPKAELGPQPASPQATANLWRQSLTCFAFTASCF